VTVTLTLNRGVVALAADQPQQNKIATRNLFELESPCPPVMSPLKV
jgi:hypothetical protein